MNIKTKIETVKEDPKDNMVIATAIDGHGDMIVTGDNHLLSLKAFRGIKVVSIEKMLAALDNNRL